MINNPYTIPKKQSVTVLNMASTTETTNGQTANLTVDALGELLVGINITSVTGTTPVLNIYVDSLGVDGVWYNIWSGSQISSDGSQVAQLTNFGQTIRLRWVIGGTTPSFTFSASIIGK